MLLHRIMVCTFLTFASAHTWAEVEMLYRNAPTTVELQINAAEHNPAQALEIGLVVFHPGFDGDSGEARKQGIFPEIREAEASYLPYALRRTLVDSNHWGAVRVLPTVSSGTELQLIGRIISSNGAELRFHLEARDARGHIWLDREFSAQATETAYQAAERKRRRPFQDLYNEVANELLKARNQLSAKELARIRSTAELRYANSLLPDAFGSFLQSTETGQYQVLRLPAREDPMLSRVNRIREQEYLFIDTADEQYAELYTEMMPVYDLWRQFQREQVVYREAYDKRLADREKPRKDSYQALKQNYNNFRWAKLQRQEMKMIAEGFDNEVAPTTVELEGNVFRLSGSLDERYREWRRILKQIYTLETGITR